MREKLYTGKRLFGSIYSTPTRFFVFHALLFGLLALIIVPPFQSPDEAAHFSRAYQISEGIFRTQQTAIGMGGALPQSFEPVTDAGSYLVGDPNQKFSPHTTEKLFDIKLNPSVTTTANFEITAKYSPTTYIPQVIGIVIGRLLGLGPLLLMYIARLCGLLFFVAAGFFAIKLIPFRKWFFTLLLCLPMALYSASSISADPVLYGAAAVLLAVVLRVRESSVLLRDKRYLAIMTASAILLAVAKEVYVPLALLPLLLLLQKNVRSSRRLVVAIGLVVLTTLVFWAGWYAVAQHNYVAPLNRPNAYSSLQFQHIKDRPIQYAANFANTFTTFNFNPLLIEFIGNFSFLDTPLPLWMVIAFYTVLVLYALKYESYQMRLIRNERLFIGALVALTLVVMSTAIYIYWTLPSYTYIDGFQGRYFIPMALFFVAVLGKGSIRFVTIRPLKVFSILLLFSLLVLSYRFYQLPSPFDHARVQPHKLMEQQVY
jgi:uncharacterized membrane protein